MYTTTRDTFIQSVAAGYDRSQPWLSVEPVSFRRGWENNLRRRGQDRDKVRNAGIMDLSVPCERNLIFSMYGVSGWKLAPGATIYRAKGADKFNADIDRILSDDPETWVVGSTRVGQSPWQRQGTTTVTLPWGQHWWNVDSKKKFSFNGTFDYGHLPEMELIELKTIWGDEALPEVAPERAWRQLAIYIAQNAVPGGWLIYLPSDLSTLDADDDTTFAAFYMDADDAANITEPIWDMLTGAVNKLTWGLSWGPQGGTQDLPAGSPAWLQRITQNLPDCDDPDCCPKIREFWENITVYPNWMFDYTENLEAKSA